MAGPVFREVPLRNEAGRPAGRRALSIAKQTLNEFLGHQPFQMAAALSYYMLLSLAPMLLVVVGIAGLVFGHEASSGQLVHKLQTVVGRQSAAAIQSILAHASKPGSGIVSTAVGVVMLLIGASSVFVQLQTDLNRIWNVTPSSSRGMIGAFLRGRLLSLAMVLSLGFLLLVSLLVSAVISGLHNYLAHLFPGAVLMLSLVNEGVSLGLITAIIAMIFYFLPDAAVAWRDVWAGAFITSLLFTVGKYLIGLYLGNAGISSVYGAAGSLVVLMIWVYYASLIFFLGAEITRVYAARRSAIRQKKAGLGSRPRGGVG